MPIKRYYPVESSNLSLIGYDPEEETLEVTFHNKASYRYFHVPSKLVSDLLNADSIGSFFYKNIVKGQFKYEKIR